LNPHASRHMILSHACLPIPALPLFKMPPFRTTPLGRHYSFRGKACKGNFTNYIIGPQIFGLPDGRGASPAFSSGQVSGWAPPSAGARSAGARSAGAQWAASSAWALQSALAEAEVEAGGLAYPLAEVPMAFQYRWLSQAAGWAGASG
jgi:hypothetical protein